MKIIFDELAYEEYKDAIEYYEFELAGLGIRFSIEIKRALRNIKKFPQIGVVEEGDIRRYILVKGRFVTSFLCIQESPSCVRRRLLHPQE